MLSIYNTRKFPSWPPKKKMQNFFTFLLFIDYQLFTIHSSRVGAFTSKKETDFSPSRKIFQKKFGKWKNVLILSLNAAPKNNAANVLKKLFQN